MILDWANMNLVKRLKYVPCIFSAAVIESKKQGRPIIQRIIDGIWLSWIVYWDERKPKI